MEGVPLESYEVYINSGLHSTVHSTEEAWEVIGQQRIGACHEVRSSTGHDVTEFIPF